MSTVGFDVCSRQAERGHWSTSGCMVGDLSQHTTNVVASVALQDGHGHRCGNLHRGHA